jgi:hypothetical protein
MRRQILVLGALLVASLILITGVAFARYHGAFAADFAPPHACGGG